MNAVFLDVDGVLNDGKETGEIDDKYVEKLADICKQFDAEVVLYSTSKYSFDNDLDPKNDKAAQLQQALEERNIALSKTPNLITKSDVREKKANLVRPSEIISFLAKNKVRKFSILGKEKIQDKVLAQNQVFCSDGLDEEVTKEVKTIMS